MVAFIATRPARDPERTSGASRSASLLPHDIICGLVEISCQDAASSRKSPGEGECGTEWSLRTRLVTALANPAAPTRYPRYAGIRSRRAHRRSALAVAFLATIPRAEPHSAHDQNPANISNLNLETWI